MPRSPAPQPWTPEQRSAQARIAAKMRHCGPNEPGLSDERTELRTERLAAYVKLVVDAAPPLSQEQRNRVAAALGGPSTSAPGEFAAS